MSDTRKQLEGSVEHAVGMVAFLDGLTGYGSVSEMVEDWRQTIEETGEYPEWDIEDAEELAREDDIFSVLDTWALDTYAVVHRRGTDELVHSHVIVFGTGGPHIEAEVRTTGGVEVRGYWGSDRLARPMTAGNLADWLTELAESGFVA